MKLKTRIIMLLTGPSLIVPSYYVPQLFNKTFSATTSFVASLCFGTMIMLILMACIGLLFIVSAFMKGQ